VVSCRLPDFKRHFLGKVLKNTHPKTA